MNNNLNLLVLLLLLVLTISAAAAKSEEKRRRSVLGSDELRGSSRETEEAEEEEEEEEVVQYVPAILGESLTLECDAAAAIVAKNGSSGDGNVSQTSQQSVFVVEWHRWSGVGASASASVVSHRHRATVSFGPLLQLPRVVKSDEGVYRCSVFAPVPAPAPAATIEGNQLQQTREEEEEEGVGEEVEEEDKKKKKKKTKTGAGGKKRTINRIPLHVGPFLFVHVQVAAFVSDLTESPVTVKFKSSETHPPPRPPPLVRLRCSAFGQPEPVIRWQLHPQLQLQHNNNSPQQQQRQAQDLLLPLPLFNQSTAQVEQEQGEGGLGGGYGYVRSTLVLNVTQLVGDNSNRSTINLNFSVSCTASNSLLLFTPFSKASSVSRRRHHHHHINNNNSGSNSSSSSRNQSDDETETIMKVDTRTVLLHVVVPDDDDEVDTTAEYENRRNNNKDKTLTSSSTTTTPLPPEATGYCARYSGQICKGFLSGGGEAVWFNISTSSGGGDWTVEQRLEGDGGGEQQPLEVESSAAAVSGGWLNEQLVTRLYQDVVRTLQPSCQPVAHRLLCLNAFPECDRDDDGTPTPRRLPLCYEDCVATRQLFCADDWAQLASETHRRGLYVGSRGHFRLPQCERLPRIGSSTFFMASSSSSSSSSASSSSSVSPYSGGGERERSTCSRAHLTQLIPAQVTTSCIKGRGRYYQGNVSTTVSGLQCQRWDSQRPHSHNRPPLHIFPEMQGAENFCRNAGGQEPRPWCYTQDPLVRWQHCHIPQCAGDGGSSSVITSSSSSSSSSMLGKWGEDGSGGFGAGGGVDVALLPMEATFTPGFVLLLAGVGFFSLLLLLLLMLLCRRALARKRRRRSTFTHRGYQLPLLQKEGGLAMEAVDLGKLRENSTYQCVGLLQQSVHPALEKLEYPRNDIIYMRDLGQGAFGRVFQAKAPNVIKGEACTVVAVKTLKEEADEETCANFEREAVLLAELDHMNIIALLAVCAREKPLCLLLEFMALGDLRQYLRRSSNCQYSTQTGAAAVGSAGGGGEAPLDAACLTSMGRQIAAGMVYLSERGFVHRDLATRNCLVDQDLTVKIADFGLSQRISGNVLQQQQQFQQGGGMMIGATAASSSAANDDDDAALPIRWMPLESIVLQRYTTASDVWAFGVCLWEVFSLAQSQPYGDMSHEDVVRYLQAGGVLEPPLRASCAIYAVMRSCWRPSPNDRPTFAQLHDELAAIEIVLRGGTCSRASGGGGSSSSCSDGCVTPRTHQQQQQHIRYSPTTDSTLFPNAAPPPVVHL